MESNKPIHAQRLIVEEGSPTDVLGKPFSIFSKYVKIFGLYFGATKNSPDEKLLHGASVLYQYIDNDDDGIPDNDAVYSALLSRNATMIMFADEKELRSHKKFFRANEKCKDVHVQDLQADETFPGCIMPYEFDASLEECFHLVTEGYSIAYPDVFGYQRGSSVSAMLDNARGGFFKKVPKRYPEHAWFTYYDKTCDYESMIVEYIYWAMTTILGAQQHRKCEIEEEWRPCTCAELQEYDSAIFSLLTDPNYKFPTKLPQPLDCVPLHVVGTRVRSGSGSSTGSGSSSDSSYEGYKKK